MIPAHYMQAHLLLCSPVPNRPGPVPIHIPEVDDLCPNRYEATPRNAVLEDPFLCKLGRCRKIDLQTWSQIKELFSGSDYLYPVGMHKTSLAASATSEGRGEVVLTERRTCVKLTVSNSLSFVVMLAASVFA